MPAWLIASSLFQMSLVGLEHLALSTDHGIGGVYAREACFGSGRPSINRGKTVAILLRL